MPYYNYVCLIGHAGKDPTVRFTKDGEGKVASFSVATTEKYKDREETQWHNVVCFGHNAEYADKYLQKGMLVQVVGKIKYGKYTDKNGIERQTVDIVTDNLLILGKRQ